VIAETFAGEAARRAYAARATPTPAVISQVLLAVLLVQGASGNPLAGKVTTTVRPRPTGASIVVDGRLDEPVWQDARAFDAFRQRDPIEGAAPTEKTTVLVAFGKDALYVGARMHDSAPDQIVARLSRRDNDLLVEPVVSAPGHYAAFASGTF
jgi:hypothetical protein